MICEVGEKRVRRKNNNPNPQLSAKRELFYQEVRRMAAFQNRLDLSDMPDDIAAEWKKLKRRELKVIARNPDLKYGKGTCQRRLIYEAREMFGLPMFVSGDCETGEGLLLEDARRQRLYGGEFRSYARKDSSHGMDLSAELFSEWDADFVEGFSLGDDAE